ncbi:MAG TPA: hypothetical protein ENI96_09715 [Sedimenticola thiotaurini]|uniref:Ysc84 actin-binding domain-containing protein n=1 Tax=Sedimenticola thiotaurini TaxID=1543721 RepID=A0A831RPG0_9GAMM|nr:hypothetical protein [Sedimenticola thiotaurini]
MKKLIALLLLCIVAAPAWADKYDDTIATFRKSPATHEFFRNAYGYAVFPIIGKGGIGVGGAYGEGRVYRQGKYVGDARLAKLTIGWQLGGQAFSEIIFFQDKRAFDEFTSGSFEFGAGASAVAITLGTEAQASTVGQSANAGDKQVSAGYYKGMAVFTHVTGGLMYEAAIGGQTFSYTPRK